MEFYINDISLTKTNLLGWTVGSKVSFTAGKANLLEEGADIIYLSLI